jgi:hypothetical protein
VGRRSRAKRRLSAAEAEEAADAPRARRRRAALVRAAIVAAIVGFGAGWLVHLWLERSPESAAQEAARKMRDREVETTH